MPKQVNALMSDEQYFGLLQVALARSYEQRRRVTVSDIMREALESYFATKEGTPETTPEVIPVGEKMQAVIEGDQQ